MRKDRTPPDTLLAEVIRVCEKVAAHGDEWIVELGHEARDAAYYLAEEVGFFRAVSRLAGAIVDAAAEISRDWKRGAHEEEHRTDD